MLIVLQIQHKKETTISGLTKLISVCVLRVHVHTNAPMHITTQKSACTC